MLQRACTRHAPCASVARLETGSKERPSISAKPCAAAAAILKPVNEPGPLPNATPSRSSSVTPLSARISAISSNSFSVCSRGVAIERVTSAPSTATASDPTALEVSIPSSFTSTTRSQAPPEVIQPSVAANSSASASSSSSGIGGQAREEHAPVGSRAQPRVADDDQAAICEIADQPPDALLEREHGVRQLELRERIAAGSADGFDARSNQRVARHRERQLVEHDEAQRRPAHVDALPEAARAKQDRVAGKTKLLEQLAARAATLYEHLTRGRAPFDPALPHD